MRISVCESRPYQNPFPPNNWNYSMVILVMTMEKVTKISDEQTSGKPVFVDVDNVDTVDNLLNKYKETANLSAIQT